MPYVGIKRYSYRPEENDFNEFITVLSELMKFHQKSEFWKLGKYKGLFTYSGRYYAANKAEGQISWVVYKYKSVKNLLNYFNIDNKTPIDIYIRPRQIMLRKYRKELFDTTLFGYKRKPYYPTDNDNFISAITEKQYGKLKQLPQPFFHKINFKKQ